MYIRLLNCFWDLHSEISGRTRAIKWRLTRDTFQRENKFAKENTTMKVGKKVATSGESERQYEISRQINNFTWYKERLVFNLQLFFQTFKFAVL